MLFLRIVQVEPRKKAGQTESDMPKTHSFSPKHPIFTVGNKGDHFKAILKIWRESDERAILFFQTKKRTLEMESTVCHPLVCIGYRLRWRSDIWSTNRGAAEVGTPDIRPTTEDDIRHNATTQDIDLLRIIMPFRFRFYFHFRMLRKKVKQPFEASSLNSSSSSRHCRCLFEYEL